MKRMLLFLGVNLAIVVVLGLVLNIVFAVLGIPPRGTLGLLVLALVFGMGGSFISLFISKWMAKMSTGAQVIDQPRTAEEQWLIQTVSRQAQLARITMPEVAIYDSPDMNAFATGMSRNSSLIAVSTGLLRGMTRDEVEGVLAHEVSHAANGDMVTMALIQGVLNTFVIFFARIVGGMIDSAMKGDDEESSGTGFGYFIIVFVLEMIFGILASIVVMAFSRYREFHADAGAARLESREKMIAALERLRTMSGESNLPSEVSALGISGNIGSLFSSHPPLEDRIEALRQMKY